MVTATMCPEAAVQQNLRETKIIKGGLTAILIGGFAISAAIHTWTNKTVYSTGAEQVSQVCNLSGEDARQHFIRDFFQQHNLQITPGETYTTADRLPSIFTPIFQGEKKMSVDDLKKFKKDYKITCPPQ